MNKDPQRLKEKNGNNLIRGEWQQYSEQEVEQDEMDRETEGDELEDEEQEEDFEEDHEDKKDKIQERIVQKNPIKKRRKRPSNFKCNFPDCNAHFQSQEHLRRHFRKHTGEKPFVCPSPNCGKRFSRNDNMLQHMRTHEVSDFPQIELENMNLSQSFDVLKRYNPMFPELMVFPTFHQYKPSPNISQGKQDTTIQPQTITLSNQSQNLNQPQTTFSNQAQNSQFYLDTSIPNTYSFQLQQPQPSPQIINQNFDSITSIGAFSPYQQQQQQLSQDLHPHTIPQFSQYNVVQLVPLNHLIYSPRRVYRDKLDEFHLRQFKGPL